MVSDHIQFSWSLGALARASRAEIVGEGLPAWVRAVGTDSRSLPSGALFVALRGERFDGHGFVRRVVDAGAGAVLIDQTGASEMEGLEALGVPVLVVKDTLVAYGDMAAYHRRELGMPVVAVTGSNGKTTTKEFVAAALRTQGDVHRTEGNLNNLIGVPKTLLDWRLEQWAAVVEMGMNEPGEIARLAVIGAPSVGVITNVAAAHLEGLGSVEAIADAKGELFEGLPASGVGIVNLDDPLIKARCVPRLGSRASLSFGKDPLADVRIGSVRSTDFGLGGEFIYQGKSYEFELPVSGLHNGSNAAAAVAACLALGSSMEDALLGLRKVSVPGGRLRLLSGRRTGVNVIDDTYNANPASMRAAMATLADLGQGRRTVAVLGDMFELGERERKLHRETGRVASEFGVELVLTLGELGAEIAAGARAAGVEAEAFAEVDALARTLSERVEEGDWVLVKGSRGMRMERIVELLEGSHP